MKRPNAHKNTTPLDMHSVEKLGFKMLSKVFFLIFSELVIGNVEFEGGLH